MLWNEDSKEQKQITLSLWPSQPLKANMGLWIWGRLYIWGHGFLLLRELPWQGEQLLRNNTSNT